MQRDLEPLGLVGASLGVGERRVGIHVRGRADTLPVRDRAAGRACGLEVVELAARPAVAVIVPGHYDGGLLTARQVPEARQRRAVQVHLDDEVREQALLLVGLRNRDLPGRPNRAGRRRPWRRRTDRRSGSSGAGVALLSGPGRVALARVDDRTGEVVGERGRLPTGGADVAQGHSGVAVASLRV